jgi:hypothetical protein
MKHKAENLFGWYGVLAILLAYALVSFNIIVAKGIGYQLLNLTGAIGIMIEALYKRDAQPAVLNIVWAIIATIAIARLIIS